MANPETAKLETMDDNQLFAALKEAAADAGDAAKQLEVAKREVWRWQDRSGYALDRFALVHRVFTERTAHRLRLLAQKADLPQRAKVEAAPSPAPAASENVAPAGAEVASALYDAPEVQP